MILISPLFAFFSYFVFSFISNDSFEINFERSSYIESIVNSIMCTYCGFYQYPIIYYIFMTHLISDLIYFYVCNRKDYVMITHHIISLITLFHIIYIEPAYGITAISLAETTNVIFNTKLLLKSFNIKFLCIESLFFFTFVPIRAIIGPYITYKEYISLSKIDQNIIIFSYKFIILIVNIISMLFAIYVTKSYIKSIKEFYTQSELVDLIKKNGFSKVEYRNLSNGISAIHSGWKI